MKTLNKTNLFGSFMSGVVRTTSTSLILASGVAALAETLVIKGAGKVMDAIDTDNQAVKDYRDGFMMGEKSLNVQVKAFVGVTHTLDTERAMEDLVELIDDMDEFLNS